MAGCRHGIQVAQWDRVGGTETDPHLHNSRATAVRGELGLLSMGGWVRMANLKKARCTAGGEEQRCGGNNWNSGVAGGVVDGKWAQRLKIGKIK